MVTRPAMSAILAERPAAPAPPPGIPARCRPAFPVRPAEAARKPDTPHSPTGESGCIQSRRRAIVTVLIRGRPPSQVVPEARLIEELRAGPAWLPALSLVTVTPAGEVIGHANVIAPLPKWTSFTEGGTMSVVTIAEAWPAAGSPFTVAELEGCVREIRRPFVLDPGPGPAPAGTDRLRVAGRQ
jgi:hypothetical protein